MKQIPSFKYHIKHSLLSGVMMVCAILLPSTSFAQVSSSDYVITRTHLDAAGTKYPAWSPYAYCGNSPVLFVDPDGKRLIYSREGSLLGTDDGGLQGDAIIIESYLFKPGIPANEAYKYNLGLSGLIDSDAISRFNESYNNLSSRPDWDGYLTLEEANDWYRNGNGQPLFVSLEKIDLSGLVSLGDDYIGETKDINLFFGSHSANDAMVYGHIKLVRYPNDKVRSYADFYDFDIKPWNSFSSIGRNIQTIIGKGVAGRGVGYPIHLYGSSQLRPVPKSWQR